ncbi:hypothetical protein SAY87_026500 [Trapa incisa]|uniref:Protein kinase domain-containing protein n=1 Tax=Trapa incisa TaxID=236973 RepID=A0AAN7GLZ6_9MYRT|nr:hypothetical protein SAY87_026500 [Trapa incisa]
MARACEIFTHFVHLSLWVLIMSIPANGTGDSDIYCLRRIKDSLEDPTGYLSTWKFDGNQSNGFICKFTGVECWHPDENRVLSIKLADMKLKGPFPQDIRNCSSLTALDLSDNNFNGTIPSDISDMLAYVTFLDLSSNRFSGGIPAGIANCTYLNVLRLNHNQLTGQIPQELGGLSRIKEFNVANNLLVGPVPTFSKNAIITSDDYANNLGLYGGPLPACTASSGWKVKVIAGAAIGGLTIAAVIVAVVMFVAVPRRESMKKDEDPEGNKLVKGLKGSKSVKVSMFENSVSKIKLSSLMTATNNFSNNNIVGTGWTGTTYKAVLGDETSLMVKRLQDSKHSEKEFISEMTTLGMVKHNNLVPLLGFYIANSQRFLLYEYMPNGNLHDCLHPSENTEKPAMEWTMRLKIAIGAARGFAWLHHNCNPRIIHRNISSRSILLDSNFEPKISDFGLARLMNPVDTHVTTVVNGEFGDLGYIPPEYSRTLMATPKGDVYSFGVVLLELITGESPTRVARLDPEGFNGNLVEWIALLFKESRLRNAVDGSLVGKGADDEIFQTLKVACSCVLAPGPKERLTMFEVYQLLKAIGERYNFSTDNEITMPIDDDSLDPLQELIVVQ